MCDGLAGGCPYGFVLEICHSRESGLVFGQIYIAVELGGAGDSSKVPLVCEKTAMGSMQKLAVIVSRMRAIFLMVIAI